MASITPINTARQFAYISFSDGRCRRLRSRDVADIVQEAILACSATNTEATLLDEGYTIVADVKRNSSAMDGFVCIHRSQPVSTGA